MRGDITVAAGIVAAACGLALPAAASADITLTAALPQCVWAPKEFASTSLSFNLTGGVPGADYGVAAKFPDEGGTGAEGDGYGEFDANGDAAITLKGVYPLDGGPSTGMLEKINVVQTVVGGAQTTTVVGSFRAGEDAADVPLKPFNMHQARLISASGSMLAGKTAYGFVTNNAGTKVLKHFKIGKAGTCGYVSRKVVVAPGQMNGNFRLYVNAGSKFTKKDAVSTTFGVFGNG